MTYLENPVIFGKKKLHTTICQTYTWKHIWKEITQKVDNDFLISFRPENLAMNFNQNADLVFKDHCSINANILVL